MSLARADKLRGAVWWSPNNRFQVTHPLCGRVT